MVDLWRQQGALDRVGASQQAALSLLPAPTTSNPCTRASLALPPLQGIRTQSTRVYTLLTVNWQKGDRSEHPEKRFFSLVTLQSFGDWPPTNAATLRPSCSSPPQSRRKSWVGGSSTEVQGHKDPLLEWWRWQHSRELAGAP